MTNKVKIKELPKGAAALYKKIQVLNYLNPTVAEKNYNDLIELSKKTESSSFPIFSEFTQKLIADFLGSGVKKMEALIIEKYFNFLENSRKLLTKKNEIVDLPITGEGMTSALSTRSDLAPQDWFKIQLNTKIDRDVYRAVDAVRSRNKELSTVLEPAFEILFHIDKDKTFDFLSELMEHENGQDPDVSRDILKVLHKEDSIPKKLRKKVLYIAVDEATRRHWPTVSKTADQVCIVQSLMQWFHNLENVEKANTQIKLLHHMAPFRNVRKLDRWMLGSLLLVSESIDSFIDLYENVKKAEEIEDWQKKMMFRNVQTLQNVFEPVLLLIEMFLSQPTSLHHFAQTIMGLTSKGFKNWQELMRLKAEKNIRKSFLNKLKEGEPVEDIIKTLCFDDEFLYSEMLHYLDILSKQFENMKDREAVVVRLSYVLGSYYEEQEFNSYLSKRYHKLVLAVHEDNLARFLTKEQMEILRENPVHSDILNVASEARKYINSRRSLEKTTDELLAAEESFCREVRSKKAQLLHKIINT